MKGNQGNLHKAAENIDNSAAYDTFIEEEKGHGRRSKWEISCFNVADIPALAFFVPLWIGFATLIKIRRNANPAERKKKKRVKKEYYDSYYISSLQKPSAIDCAKDIRGHWGIENGLHYAKDVVMNEDNNKISGTQPAVNIATLNAVVINYFRHRGFSSIHDSQIKFAYNFKKEYFNL